MTTASTQNRIINLICNDIAVDLSAEDITAQSSLFDDLSFDSIKMIELLTKLEQEFEIELDDEDLDFQVFATINTLTTFVDSVRAGS